MFNVYYEEMTIDITAHTEGPAWFVMCKMCNDDWNTDHRRWSKKMSPHKRGPKQKKVFPEFWIEFKNF